MSELPELRDLVRGVAERRVRRRRVRLAAPAVAFSLAAAVAFLPGTDRRNDEVPAGTPPTATPTPERNPFTPQRRDPNTPPATLEQARAEAKAVLGVLRRPARQSDRLEQTGEPGIRLVPTEADWDTLRRVATFEDIEQFVMPGTSDGIAGLCFVSRNRHGGGVPACSPGRPTVGYPYWSRTSDRKGPIYAALFPDGIDRITLHLKSGETSEREIVDNGLIFQQRGLKEISWLDPSGQEHRKRLAV